MGIAMQRRMRELHQMEKSGTLNFFQLRVGINIWLRTVGILQQ